MTDEKWESTFQHFLPFTHLLLIFGLLINGGFGLGGFESLNHRGLLVTEALEVIVTRGRIMVTFR